MSMFKGLDPEARDATEFVTVDTVAKNENGFRGFPNIKRVTGNSLDERTVEKVRSFFSGKIGLLYVDSVHTYSDTEKNIELYGKALEPDYIILDDIRQCADMKKLWRKLKKTYDPDAYDASDVAVRKGAGFGVLRGGG